MVKAFYISLILLSVAQFIFSGYYFYLSKQKLKTVPKKSVNGLKSFVKINTPLITQDYDFKDVVIAINTLIESLNKTNKGSYIATGTVTIFSGLVTLLSAFILYFNF